MTADQYNSSKKTAERAAAGLSRWPIFKVAGDTIRDLDFDPHREHSDIFRIPDISGEPFFVFSPKAALIREVVLVIQAVPAFGRDYYRSYVGVIDKPQFIETAAQDRVYQEQLIALVSPKHVVHAQDLDRRMRELGGLPPRAV
jgi:hypothetical protein